MSTLSEMGLKKQLMKLTFGSGLTFGVIRAERGVLFLCEAGVARLAGVIRLAGVTLKPSLDD